MTNVELAELAVVAVVAALVELACSGYDHV